MDNLTSFSNTTHCKRLNQWFLTPFVSERAMCSLGHILDVYELLTAPPKSNLPSKKVIFPSEILTWFDFNKYSNDPISHQKIND